MRHEIFPAAGRLYSPCAIGRSRLVYRGPPRVIEGDFIACLGDSETLGPGVTRPFAARLERSIGMPVLNMGCLGAGCDAFVKDPGALDAARAARIKVLQVLKPALMTNRLYSVHPRRNDRFLRATPELQRCFPEVDFTDFAFIHHMLRALQQLDHRRFEYVCEEMRTAWLRGMHELSRELGEGVILLHIDHADQQGPAITPDMLRALKGPVLVQTVDATGHDAVARAHQQISDALYPLIVERSQTREAS